MSKFLNMSVNIMVYDSTSQTNDPTDAIKLKNVIQDTSVSAGSRLNPLPVPTATVDQAVALPASTCNYLVILTDQVVSVKVNGGSAQILRPIADGVKTCALMMRGDITSLSVSNSSGKTANLDVIAVKN